MKNTTQPTAPLASRGLWCADDFGLHPYIDEAVLQLAASDRLQATSCLVNGASFVTQAQALRQSGLQTGLHLNFTEHLSHTIIQAPLSVLMRQAWLRQLDARKVEHQIQQQWDRFTHVMGRIPDFVDGHQHVHQFPVIREALFRVLHQVASTARRPWIRSTRPGSLRGLPLSQQFKAHSIFRLGATALGQLASQYGFLTNARFFGVYDFQGGAAAYAAYIAVWKKYAQVGDLIMCHPACAPVPGDVLGTQRVAEFQVLMAS